MFSCYYQVVVSLFPVLLVSRLHFAMIMSRIALLETNKGYMRLRRQCLQGFLVNSGDCFEAVTTSTESISLSQLLHEPVDQIHVDYRQI